jgi:predicted heme/steroid binding protein/uncharacterized membrane protein
MKEIDPEELTQFDGKEGNPVYIAQGGRVFDVSGSTLWKGGLHMGRHHAGKDLTTDIQAAPHGTEVLERYPQIGVLKEGESTGRQIPEALSRLLKRFPMLRRHPHPMMVHFPIVFMFSTTVFALLYLFTGIASLELTGLYCLGAGLLFTPIAMATGYYTWWLNYMAKPLRPVIIKQRLSIILLLIEIVAFVWRMAVPDILMPLGFASCIYLILILSLLPIVIVLGWYGASLTFPIEKK